MNKIYIFFGLVLLVSCAPNEVPSNKDLVERDGIKYEVNSQTPFTGTNVEFHENGQLKSKENFKDGELDGLSEYYYMDGQLQSKLNYIDGKLDGLWIGYFENGQLQFKRNYIDGKLDGLWIEYFHRNSQERSLLCFKNGELLGTTYTFSCEK